MAYEKTTWVDGETEIDAQKLNKMEEGIVEASQTGGILTGSIVAYDGDTIPEGYEEVSSDGILQLTDIITSSNMAGNIQSIIKNGKIVVLDMVQIWMNSLTANTWTTVGKVPESVKPSREFATTCFFSRGLDGNKAGYGKLSVTATGEIKFKADTSYDALVAVGCNLVWILD